MAAATPSGGPVPVIATRQLVKTYHGGAPVYALRGVDLEIAAGELVAIMGSSGSGKSTLMNLLGCLDKKTSGSYQLDGVEVSSLSADQLADLRNERIGFVFQGFNLLARTSALANVELPLVYARRPLPGKSDVLARQALERVGAAGLADRSVDELSDGELQRVAIARALAQEAEILLLDEATAFLDLPRRVETFALLRRLAHQQHKAILLSTHDLDLALRCADELWLLAPPAELRCGPPEVLALDGSFAEAFAGPGLGFDLASGSFRFTGERRGEIAVDLIAAPPPAGAWLLRALERLGWQVATTAGDGLPRLTCAAISGNLVFTVKRGGESRQFGSLLALIEELEQP